MFQWGWGMRYNNNKVDLSIQSAFDGQPIKMTLNKSKLFFTGNHCLYPDSIEQLKRQKSFVKKHNQIIKNDDWIVYMGNIVSGRHPACVMLLNEFLSQTLGKKILVLGEHDRLPLNMYKKAGFIYVTFGLELKSKSWGVSCVENGSNLLSMIYPWNDYINDENDTYNPINKDLLNEFFPSKYICGHLQNDTIFKVGPLRNVSVNANKGYPISFYNLEKSFGKVPSS